MAESTKPYPVKFDVDYPKSLDRASTFFRALLSIPIVILFTVLTTSGGSEYVNEAGQQIASSGGGITSGLFGATMLMILFRQKYPKWWYNFALELYRFSARIGAYVFLLTDKYPSTDQKQSVTLNLEYPDAKQLSRGLPLVKWFLAIPHYVVLMFLMVGAIGATVIAWFAILFTGQYPKGLFDYVVGVGRWCTRVTAYAFLLTTDEYPPFSLD